MEPTAREYDPLVLIMACFCLTNNIKKQCRHESVMSKQEIKYITLLIYGSNVKVNRVSVIDSLEARQHHIFVS